MGTTTKHQHESWSGRISSILIDGFISFTLMRADVIRDPLVVAPKHVTTIFLTSSSKLNTPN